MLRSGLEYTLSKFSIAILLLVVTATQVCMAQTNTGKIELEMAAVWQNKNTIQIPSDQFGTRFSAPDIVGDGPWGKVRVNGEYSFNDKHGLRVVLSPFSYTKQGRSVFPINFKGQNYLNSEDFSIKYKFNSWRLGYQYHYFENDQSDIWVGVTAKIRDAEISLQQGNTSSRDANFGFVPLIYLAGKYRFNERWSVFADIDGLAGGPGRAFDMSAKVNYAVNSDWGVSLGYRMLEGGVDGDEVYNFAWFNSFIFSAYRYF